MSFPSTIAIDGPVASGKSAVGKQLAARLGYLYFDTGVMYRAVTCLALRELGTADDPARVTALAERTQIGLQPPTEADGRDCTVTAGGEDITWAIRSGEVENNVSLVAAIPAVRQILTQRMRQVGLRGRVVMLGRDVGTVILPEADLKIFLTADVETRARRRFDDEQARGGLRSYHEILSNLRERDRIDSSRALAPLRAAADAVHLDTTDLDLPGVMAALEQIIARSA
jgi:cytidylate kinase